MWRESETGVKPLPRLLPPSPLLSLPAPVASLLDACRSGLLPSMIGDQDHEHPRQYQFNVLYAEVVSDATCGMGSGSIVT
jgi:hypothetical protein